MKTEEVNFEAGDTIAIVEHRRAPVLYPDRVYTVEASDGWVIDHIDRGRYPRVTLWLYKLVPGEDDYRAEFVEVHHARLVSKGQGRFVPGVSLPHSPRQLKQMRFDAFAQRVRETLDKRPKFEGWANPATWQTYLLLRNNSHFMLHTLPSLRRKDGTVNLKKLVKEWRRPGGPGEKLEPWVYEPVIDVPEEFKHYRIEGLAERVDVRWADIELELRAEKPAAQ